MIICKKITKEMCNMVITRRDIETKEIEIPGFRKILKDPKNPDYKELRIYIKNGWIPLDPEDDEREIEKAKKRKKIAKENKERRPSYAEMEKNIKKLKDNQKILDEFNEKKVIKNNYINTLKWYNQNVRDKVVEQIAKEKEQNKADATPKKTEKETKGEVK